MLGNTALLRENGISVEAMATATEALQSGGASVMHLGVDGALAGSIALSDPIKATTAEALATLESLGIRTVMATGDRLSTARAVAARHGLDEVHAEVKPAENALGVPLVAGVLNPLTGGLLSPMVAAAAMSLSSASVIFNALRLRAR